MSAKNIFFWMAPLTFNNLGVLLQRLCQPYLNPGPPLRPQAGTFNHDLLPESCILHQKHKHKIKFKARILHTT